MGARELLTVPALGMLVLALPCAGAGGVAATVALGGTALEGSAGLAGSAGFAGSAAFAGSGAGAGFAGTCEGIVESLS